jgi:hypothetical protein
MRHTTGSTLVAILLLLLLQLPKSAFAQDQVDFRLRFVNGQTRHVDVTLDQVIDRVIREARQETTQNIVLRYALTVSSVDSQGVAVITVKYEAMILHSRSPVGEVNYDSSNAASQVPVMASGLAAMVGRQFSITVTPAGRVTRVDGLQKLMESVLNVLAVPDGPTRVAVEKTVRQQLDEQNVRANLQNIFAPFPDHPVLVGETWERKTDVNFGFPMTTAMTFTLSSRAQGVATVKVAGTVAMRPNTSMDLKPVKMDIDLRGDQTGTLLIDENNGWTKQADVSQTLNGSVTVRTPESAPETVPVTIQTKLGSITR